MRTKAGAAPPALAVRRDFETNRLAKDVQARAYELVVPIHQRPAGAEAAPAGADGAENEPPPVQGGIAA